MLKQSAIVLFSCVALAACASDDPRIIHATANTKEIHLMNGMATQVQLPADEQVQSAVTGNPDLVTVGRADNVVNLVARPGAVGTTNLIVRSTDSEGQPKVYQYILSLK